MAVEFWGVEALNGGNSGGVRSRVEDPRSILKDVLPFREVIDEEMRGGVAGHFVVPQSILVAVARQYLERFDAASALIFEVNKFHITVNGEENANDELVSDGEGIVCGGKRGKPWALGSGDFLKQLFGQF